MEAMQARQGERIENPTAVVVLPTKLLAALGNTHVCLGFAISKVQAILDTVGWPEGDSIEKYALDQPILTTAVDYARENARLTWVLEGMLDALGEVIGEFQFEEIPGGGRVLISMGEDPSLEPPGEPHTFADGSVPPSMR